MSPIRSILLHLDATAGSRTRLGIAEAVAAQHGARVTALFGVRPDDGRTAFAYSAAAALSAGEGHAARPHSLERERLRKLCDSPGVEFTWNEVVGNTVTNGFLAEAAFADLLILGQPTRVDEAKEAPAGFIESVILDSGVPAIVVPSPYRQEAFGQRLLLAWDGSASSARAIRAAIPFMAHAAEVHVVSWAAHAPTAPYSGLDLSAWLQRHEIAARIHLPGPTRRVGDALAATAGQLQADLVVMGCYGHNRLRERIWGGATKVALASLPVPLFMVH